LRSPQGQFVGKVYLQVVPPEGVIPGSIPLQGLSRRQGSSRRYGGGSNAKACGRFGALNSPTDNGRNVPGADIANVRNSLTCCDGARLVAATSRSLCGYRRSTVES
jgi:hypothetical protein